MIRLVRRSLHVTVVLLASVPFAMAQEKQPCPCAGEAQAMMPPRSSEEALKLAERYDRKAAAYREEAAAHRRMVTEVIEKTAPPIKGAENPAVKKMREHCEVYIDRAKQLAVAAERLADYYRLRAEELKEQ
jgi:hypothetical protein